MQLSFEQIRAYFEARHPGQPIPSRAKVVVRCAFHPDKNPSCTLFLDGNGGFYCHGCGAKGNTFQFEMRFSNCSMDEARQKIADLTGARMDSGGSQGQCTAVYDYRLADGTTSFQKRRYESPEGGKKFAIFRPDGKAGWLAGLDEAQKARKVLCNLPDLVTANLALLAEGEKDCDNLNRQNLFSDKPHIHVAATTNCEGAWRQGDSPKWLDSYSPYFAGKHVVIFEDNDDSGRTWATYVATEVSKYAHSVRRISFPDLPEKGDVSDWLLDHSKDELQKLIDAAPVWTPQAVAIQPSMTPETAAIATAQLLDAIRSWILTYVVISEEQATILAVWELHTYVLDASDITPYIHITAPEKESGKSLLMDVLAAVACNPIRSGGMTAAALVRMVDKHHPTVFLDEMDAAMGGDKEFAEAQRGILNEGFKRGGRFFKCDGKDHELRDFDVFSCKCFAGIGKLPDTVTSRSIVIEMRRKLPTEVVARFRQRVVKIEASPLRSSLNAWASKGAAALLQKIEPTPIPNLGDRQNDVCEPLLAIAQLAGETYLQRLVGALMAVFGASGAEDASTGVALLRDIRAAFEALSTDKIPSKTLAEILGATEGSPWPDWKQGKPISANQIARMLQRYGIRPQTIRVDCGTPKGYRRCDFEDAWARYCPLPPTETATPPQPSSLLAETSYSNRNTQPPVAVVESPSNPREQRLVAGVAVQNGESANTELRI
jgi:hypothetical protein